MYLEYYFILNRYNFLSKLNRITIGSMLDIFLVIINFSMNNINNAIVNK